MAEMNNSVFGVLFSFISMITGTIGVIKVILRFTRKNTHSILSYSLLILISLLGFLLPLLILLSGNWVGWKHILLNIVAIYALLNFIFLLYIIRVMKQPKSQLQPKK